MLGELEGSDVVADAEVVGEEETKDQESGERAEMESNVRLADCTV